MAMMAGESAACMSWTWYWQMLSVCTVFSQVSGLSDEEQMACVHAIVNLSPKMLKNGQVTEAEMEIRKELRGAVWVAARPEGDESGRSAYRYSTVCRPDGAQPPRSLHQPRGHACHWPGMPTCWQHNEGQAPGSSQNCQLR
jgi:hypothetical protein